MSHSPLTYLLERRAAREAPDRMVPMLLTIVALAWLALVALMGLAGANLTPELLRGVAACMLFCATPVALLGTALRQVVKDSSLHDNFQAGRCYPEILGTRLRAGEMVDQVALHSARQSLRLTLKWTPVFAGLWLMLYPELAGRILMAAAAWVPLSLVLTWSTSYLGQQMVIIQGQMRSTPAGSLGEATLASLTTFLVVVLMAISVGGAVAGSPRVALLGLAAYVMLGRSLCRWLAVVGIEKLPRVRLRLQLLGRRWTDFRNRYLLCWSQNPIVVRELRRDARRLPFQAVGAWFYFFPLGTLMVLLGAQLYGQTTGHDARLFSSWLILASSLISFATAGGRCSTAIAGEIESQSMEPLQNTRLRTEEFLSGWLQVGAVPRIVDGLMVVVACQLTVGHVAWDCLPLVLVAPLAGAASGLACSYASNRQTAARQRGEWVAVLVFGWLMLNGVLAMLNLTWMQGYLLFSGYLLATAAISLSTLWGKIDIAKSR